MVEPVISLGLFNALDVVKIKSSVDMVGFIVRNLDGLARSMLFGSFSWFGCGLDCRD